MDAVSEPGVDRVALMTSAQVGKTEVLNNIVGFHIAQDAAPILVLQPTLEMAETWSKDRLAPMLRDTPALADRVADPRARDSGNTMLHKRFAGGHVTVVGANSPASLASRPIRIVLADEVDRYPPSAGTEGDPLSLAIKRTTTFWNRRVVVVSTPTIKGFSRIEAEFERSDKRRYFVRCAHCEHDQHLSWANVHWPEGRPEQARYHCEACGAEWSDAERRRAIAQAPLVGAGWRATAPFHGVAGFHLNELYSSWSTPAKMAIEFVAAQHSHETKKAWVNTVLGETYEEDAEKVDHHVLADRLEDWAGADDDIVPPGVLIVTCGVDVQADRIEVERVGWGIDEESWSLDHHVLWGDPSDPSLWRQLDAYLLRPSYMADGRELNVRTTCIDSGGHHTQTVYKFCKARRRRRVFAIKGMGGVKVVWPTALQSTKRRSDNVVIVGVDAAKDAVYAYLKTAHAGPGFCHFPVGRSAVWFEQLTAEVVQTKYVRGHPQRIYVLPDGRRNEALDCRVYAYAALQSMQVRWGTEMAAAVAAPRLPQPKAGRARAAQDEGGLPAPEVQAKVVAQERPARQSRHGFLGGRSNWLRGR